MLRIKVQDRAVSKSQMSEANAPGYDFTRVGNMRKEGLLTCKLGSNLEGIYTVSEHGKAELLEMEYRKRKDDEEAARRKIQNKISMAQELTLVVTFILGLLVGYFGNIVGFVVKLFSQWWSAIDLIDACAKWEHNAILATTLFSEMRSIFTVWVICG